MQSIDIGSLEHPKDRFGSRLEEGDTIAFITHGDFRRAMVVGFTSHGVRTVRPDGLRKTVLRDRVIGPRALGTGGEVIEE